MTPKRIMIVDDESDLSGLCRLMLETARTVVVREVSNGSLAADAAREFRPDVILLDWQLPGKCGMDVAAELRADPLLRSIPIVFITGSLTREEAACGIFEGCSALAKPFHFPELLSIVDAQLATIELKAA